MSIKAKVTLVTGGMGGIGTSICQLFAQEEGIVIAAYHQNQNHDAAITWQNEQKKQGYPIAIHYVDINSYESCGELVQDVETQYGIIDILINNAGITRDTQLYKMTPVQWHEVIQTNLDGLFNVTRHAINGMIQKQYGRIINISSINGQKGQFGQVNYAASKAGVHGFTKSLAQEVARKGITVNTISPGYIETNMVKTMAQDVQEKIKCQIPVGRFGKPEEIARAALFLASENSGFITGSNLTINGGQYLV